MIVQKKRSLGQIFRRIKGLINPSNIMVNETSPNMQILKDIHIPVRDGSYLSANIYMPTNKRPFPSLICLHPGRKDVVCKDGYMHIQFRFARIPGTVMISDETSFEAPDPDFWVANGYAIVNIDKRGFGLSPRGKGPQMYFGQEEIEDLYDAIEWAGTQSWSNGNVGLFGVSYLAMNQYKVAELNPPHLKAICPWEGVSDLYKDWFYPGGVREDGFTPFLFNRLQTFGFGYDMRQEQLNRETRDDWWKSFVPDFEKITLPILNCISFSSQMFHSRGSTRVYESVGSTQKWLYTHRGGEWTEYYSSEVTALVLKFFDYFLKGHDNGMPEHPKVRLEVREFGDEVKEVRYETQWPPENVEWILYQLNCQEKSISPHSDVPDSDCAFDLVRGSVYFSLIFTKDTEIVGSMKLTLFVEIEDCEDANIFAGIQKFRQGREVNFEGVYGFENDLVSKTALRVALRTVNESLSLPYSPEYNFDILKPLKKGEIAKLEFQFSPSATFFAKGDELRLVLQGQYFINKRRIHHVFSYRSNTKGICKIHTSGKYPSNLLMPVITK